MSTNTTNPVASCRVTLTIAFGAGLLAATTSSFADRGVLRPHFAGATSATTASQPVSTAVALPLSFEPNLGQIAAGGDYVARARGYAALLTADTLTIYLSDTQTRSNSETDSPAPGASPRTATLRMQFVGSNTEASATPLERQRAQSHYLRSADASGWITQVPHYQSIRYNGIYPGIDLVYYGNEGKLQYDFIVAPDSDPTTIRLRFDSEQPLRVGTSGSLEIGTALGLVGHAAPRIYQQADKDGTLREIPGGFVTLDNGDLAFDVGQYDTAMSLVIDPLIEVATYFGGSGDDTGNLARDAAGNIVVGGRTASLDFPTEDPLQAGYTGARDAFIARFDPTGTILLSSTYFGGSGDDTINVLEYDGAGNIIAAGYTSSPDFPTANAAQSVFRGGGFVDSDAFVIKLNASADTIVYSTFLGGTDLTSPLRGYEWARGLFIDADDNVYVTGETAAPDFPATHLLDGRACLADEGSAGGSTFISDAFIAKFAPDGTLQFATCLGATARDAGRDIAVAGDGSIWVNGHTRSADFPVTLDAFQDTYAGSGFDYDVYVARLNAGATTIDYATYIGGSDLDYSEESVIDADGNYTLTGIIYSVDFPTTPGAFQTVHSGPISDNQGPQSEAAVIGFASDNTLRFSTFLGGFGEDDGFDIELGPAGRLYVAGYTAATNFPGALPVPGARGRIYGSSRTMVAESGPTYAIAYGNHINGLNDVVIVGNDGANRVYERVQGTTTWTASDLGPHSSFTRAVLVGIGGNNSDVITGNDGDVNRFFAADPAGGYQAGVAIGTEIESTRGVAVGQLAGPFIDYDLVVVNFGQPDRVYFADPEFATSTELAGGPSPSTAVAVGGLNGTGANDIAIAREGEANVLYYSNSDGTFEGPIQFGPATANTRAIALGDVDDDGDNDIVTGNCGSPNRVYFHEGFGVFSAGADISAETDCTNAVVLTDVNFDDVPDLIVGNDGPDRLYLNTGGSFVLHESLDDSNDITHGIASSEDLDFGDGYPGTVFAARQDAINPELPYSPYDIFVAVLDATGSTLETSVYVGSDGDDFLLWGLSVDSDGDAWIAGYTNGQNFPTVNALQVANAGRTDAVLAEIVLDFDRDGVFDSRDNCTEHSNAAQRDTDADDIGNICDPDVALPNDCTVNFLDLNVYRANFFQAGDLDTDNNGDGQTNFLDLNIVRSLFFGPPGPSAAGCN